MAKPSTAHQLTPSTHPLRDDGILTSRSVSFGPQSGPTQPRSPIESQLDYIDELLELHRKLITELTTRLAPVLVDHNSEIPDDESAVKAIAKNSPLVEKLANYATLINRYNQECNNLLHNLEL